MITKKKKKKKQIFFSGTKILPIFSFHSQYFLVCHFFFVPSIGIDPKYTMMMMMKKLKIKFFFPNIHVSLICFVLFFFGSMKIRKNKISCKPAQTQKVFLLVPNRNICYIIDDDNLPIFVYLMSTTTKVHKFCWENFWAKFPKKKKQNITKKMIKIQNFFSHFGICRKQKTLHFFRLIIVMINILGRQQQQEQNKKKITLFFGGYVLVKIFSLSSCCCCCLTFIIIIIVVVHYVPMIIAKYE